MKIERETITTMTLEEFADKHKLVMVVTEREKSSYREPFTAQFKNCCIMDGSMLNNLRGFGSSETEAIYDYAHLISCQTLAVIESKDRRNLNVPVLTYNARGKACPPEPKAVKPVKTRRNSSPAPTAE